MSTFKEITGNTLTNNGEAISGRLLYTQLGGNESKPVYFGLKDGADSWTGNLSTIATSGFYLTSNVSGCTALVKYDLPTNIDPNTAREIWLNIPSTTTSRTIQFSYNGITVLTVKQEITQKTKYNIIIAKPYWYNVSSNNISSPMYYLSMDNEYNEEYIAKSGGNNVNLLTNNYTDVYLCFIDMELNGSNMIFNNNTIENLSEQYNLEYVSGDLFGNATNSYICSFPHGMYDSEQDIQITNLYKNESYNGSTIYLWYPATTQGSSNTFICCGEFSWHDNINCRRGYYTLEA